MLANRLDRWVEGLFGLRRARDICNDVSIQPVVPKLSHHSVRRGLAALEKVAAETGHTLAQVAGGRERRRGPTASDHDRTDDRTLVTGSRGLESQKIGAQSERYGPGQLTINARSCCDRLPSRLGDPHPEHRLISTADIDTLPFQCRKPVDD
jgi:hypothetical protein